MNSLGIFQSDVAAACFKFYWNQMSEKEFERILYTSKDLEICVGKDLYLEMVGFNYSDKNGVYGAKQIIAAGFDFKDPERLFKERVIELAKEMLNGKVDYKSGCIELWSLYEDGHEFIPIEFVGYGSELEEGQPISFYEERIERDLKSLLKFLEC